MGWWSRLVTTVGAARTIGAVGGLYILLAVSLAVMEPSAGRSLEGAILWVVLPATPGALLLYGGYRLTTADLQPAVYPRIVAWTAGGWAVMLTVVGLVHLNPAGGLDRPVFSLLLATGLGSVAGLANGANEARAISRAAEAQQRRDEVREERDLRQRIVATSPVGILVVDADGQIASANDHAVEVLGYTEAELTDFQHDEPIFQTTGPNSESVDDDLFTRVVSTRSPVYDAERQVTRADGQRIWLSVNAAPFSAPTGETTSVVFAFEDITDRKELEADLRRERDLRERVFETSPTGIVVVDAAGSVLFINEYASELIGLQDGEVDDLETIFASITVRAPDGTAVEGRVWEEILASGVPIYDVERRIVRPDGASQWISVNGAPLRNSDDGTTGVVFTLEDITDRKQYQDRLISLNELSKDLTDAETERAVSDLVVETASDILPIPQIAIALYDEDSGGLQYTARTAAVQDLDGDTPLFRGEQGLPWQVFSTQSPAVHENLLESGEVAEDDTPLRCAMLFPLGEHGVFVGGATAPGAFTDIDVSVAQMLVAHTRSALDRVTREQTVREQRDTLAERAAALERVQRINRTIRGITTDLIQASTRNEVVQSVCDRLAEAETYRVAWIGSHDAVTDEVTPEAWAGVDDGILETLAVTADEAATGEPPTGNAIRTRETEVRNSLAAEPPFASWEQAALDRGYQATIAVPLIYQDALYGVLTLYADESDVFNQMEEAVLTELGETIGYALNALERKRALVSDQSVELEFRVRNGDPPLFRLAAEHDATFEFENIVQRTGGVPGIFFTIRGVPAEEVLAFGENCPEIEELVLVSDRDDESLLEARLSDSTFFSALLDRGAMPQTLAATGEEGTAVIRVPQTSNIRSFVELFERRYATVDLVGRREIDEPIKTQQEFEAEFRTQLTDRQEEILNTAYTVGFFESPRETTAQELAEMLGVSQPTVSRHIRAGERKLFGLLFDEP